MNAADDIFYREGVHGGWRGIDGKLKYVSVNSTGRMVLGVNAEDDIFWREGVHGNWHQVDGKLKCVHVSGDHGEHWCVSAAFRPAALWTARAPRPPPACASRGAP